LVVVVREHFDADPAGVYRTVTAPVTQWTSQMPNKSTRNSAIRPWLAAGLVAAALLASPLAARAQVVVLANGSPITEYDIQQRTKLVATSSHKTPSRQEVINDLIDDRLKISRAKVYGLDVNDTEVNTAFQTMATRQHITPQQFSQVLERAGISPNTVKARIRAELTWNQLVRGKFGPSLQIGEADIANALKAKNEAETSVAFMYTLYPVTIIVPQGSNEGVLQAKHQEAENLRARFQSCKDGLAMARSLRDVAVREPVNRSSADLAPALRDMLNSIPVGHLTSPDVTQQGLQMFAVCEKKQTTGDSPAQREVREQLFTKRFETEANKYLDEIRKQAMIEYK
jgi:peptidyl-prolyl cis-trans isomerase SurA